MDMNRNRVLMEIVEAHISKNDLGVLVDPGEIAASYMAFGPRGMVSLLKDLLETDRRLTLDVESRAGRRLLDLKAASSTLASTEAQP